jgi:hypothetical protein
MPFVYNFDALKALSDSLTQDRLTAYLVESKGDLRAAIALYEHNTRLSEAIYGVTQGIEIAFRNACHTVISARTTNPAWYDMRIPVNPKHPLGPSMPLLHPPEAGTVADAKNELARWGKRVTPGRVVAELTFGF